jgi:hypothetical protein
MRFWFFVGFASTRTGGKFPRVPISDDRFVDASEFKSATICERRRLCHKRRTHTSKEKEGD